MQSFIPLRTDVPRLVTAAHKGGAGKTLITVGLVAALKRRGVCVGAFKKGPDYIDAGWLGLAAGEPCHNLDTYLFKQDVVTTSFIKRSAEKQISIVEGNRGLFDGVNTEGSYSTAEMAKLLKAPVVLIVDATKMTRTAAALVLGCRLLDKDLDIAGVILNRVAGDRHERILRQAIEESASVPVIGSVRKLALRNLPQRHLGLLPLYEHPGALQFIDDAADLVEKCVDLDGLMLLAKSAEPLELSCTSCAEPLGRERAESLIRIGIVRDSAFQFYYPENLEALSDEGAELVEISALVQEPLPNLDALYIGGGFPETHAQPLADNEIFKQSLLNEVRRGLPVYAECGGLMYLSRNLVIDGKSYPMAGVFPMDAVLERKPRGLGYSRVEVMNPNPFYPRGTVLTGHEFHYSSVRGLTDPDELCAFKVLRGHGIDGSRDGVCFLNALGTYVHIHALGEPLWASGIVNMAVGYRSTRGDRVAVM
jgi:cobyrinic acid a,c-diamide synthase